MPALMFMFYCFYEGLTLRRERTYLQCPCYRRLPAHLHKLLRYFGKSVKTQKNIPIEHRPMECISYPNPQIVPYYSEI